MKSISLNLAYKIMGKNIWLPEDWILSYGWKPSQEQLRQVAEFPWDENILNSKCLLCGKTVKDCHFPFWGIERLNGKPLTILKLQELHPATAQPRFFQHTPDAWYSKEKFATETTCDLRWYLLHTNIVPKSEDKTFDEQKAMLPEEYEVPYAVSEFAKNLLIFKKIGVYANPSRYGRCADVDSDGIRVYVGYFAAGGLGVGGCWVGGRYCDIGVAASRKILK